MVSDQSDQLLVKVEPSKLEVEPGGPAVEVVVSIQNLSNVVEQYNVDLVGLDAEWYTAPVAAVGLFPQDQEQVRISLHPPRRSGQRAGTYPFQIRVRSKGGMVAQNVEGSVAVRGAAVFRLEDVAPRRQTARDRGTFRVELSNSGTADVQVELSARDDEEACDFRFQDPAPVVAANSKRQITLTATPRARPMVGQERSYNFTVTARPMEERAEPQTAKAQFIHRPVLPSWSPVWKCVKWAAIGVGAVALAVFLMRTGTTAEFLRRLQNVRTQACDTGLRTLPILNSICPSIINLPPIPTREARPTATTRASASSATTSAPPAAPAWLAFGSSGSGPGQFRHPYGVAVDAQGNAYVADTNNNRVQKLSPAGQPVTQWGGQGSAPGQFKRPFGVAVDVQGNLYVADTENHRIQKLSPDGQPVAQWGSKGTGPGQFDTPTGIWVTKQGEIYVAEFANNRVQKLAPDGRPAGMTGSAGSGPGQFKGAADVVVDQQGNMYVADQDNHRVQKLAPNGQPVAQWGSQGSAPGQFEKPGGVAVDAQGNLYVADYGNNRVQQLSPAGQPIANTIPPGQFNHPSAVALDEQGNLWVADTDDDRVQRLARH